MLVTKLKNSQELDPIITRKSFIIKCFGCAEVLFPEREIDEYLREKRPETVKRLDYLCNEIFTGEYVAKYSEQLGQSANIIVFSCGIGVQTVAALMEEMCVLPGCDTFYINGFQGLKSAPADCEQCAECRLNHTAGICPLTACSKSLINGQCGGADEGKCEANNNMECGWERIYKRLSEQNNEQIMKARQEPRNYLKMIEGDEKTGKE